MNKKEGNFISFRHSEKGQMTIFVIIGLIVVAVIILLIIFSLEKKPDEDVSRERESGMRSYLPSCISEEVDESVEILLENGGYINPDEDIISKRFRFEGEEYKNISYLCYNRNYYQPCINQQPMLIQHLKSEIHSYISEDVKNCFNQYQEELEKEGFSVDGNYNGFEVKFKEGEIIIEIDGRIEFSHSGTSEIEENFEVNVPTKFYDLAVVVQEITSQEARFCHFSNQGFSLFYPEFDINVIRTSDLEKVYNVKHESTGEEFKFAVRGCVNTPGPITN